MSPSRDAPDRSYHQTADSGPTRRLCSRCNEIPFELESVATSRLLADATLRQGGTDLRISEGQQRRAKIHRKCDLMKQTQDHDGDVRTGGGETQVVQNSVVYR
jgi:hypothetical protein